MFYHYFILPKYGIFYQLNSFRFIISVSIFSLFNIDQGFALDFQSYAKPSRLLSATEANTCTEVSLEKLVKAFDIGQSNTLYKVELRTSNFYGSGLTDINSGVQLCVIDENGYSILQRLPASTCKEQNMQSDNEVISDVLHLQRGSIDVFTFKGPKLQKIIALWISPVSGQYFVQYCGSLNAYCQNDNIGVVFVG